MSKYRNDDTDFRGDENEGKIPIDPISFAIRGTDGKDLFNELGIPRPDSVMSSLVGDDDLFMFCAAMINDSVLQTVDDRCSLTPEFGAAIRQFGDYAFLFLSAELEDRLSKARENHTPGFGFMSGPIIYRDLAVFNSEEYKKTYRLTGSLYDPFFVKSIDYKIQNEWRLVIVGSEEKLSPNNGDAFSINIGAFNWGFIFHSDTLIKTLELVL